MDDLDLEDDDMPMAYSTDMDSAFAEFMETDGNELGGDEDVMLSAFVGGAAAALMLLGARLQDASGDMGGTIPRAAVSATINDLFKELHAIANGDADC